MVELTEKYHLVNEDGHVKMNINGWIIQIKDFSDIKTLGLINKYVNEKQKLQLIVRTIAKGYELFENIETEEFNEWVSEGIYKAFEIITDIFSNMFVEGWDDIKERDFNNIFKNPDAFSLLSEFIEMLDCIDIAIYSGFKYINENKEEIFDKIINDVSNKFKFIVIDSNGKTIVDKEEISKIMKKAFNDIENKSEVKPEIDLSKIKTIGNA